MYNCLPCFLKCLTDFEMRESVIKLLVLYPPSPPSYTFRSCPKKNESNQYNYQDSHNTSTLENIEKSIGKVKKVELVTTEIDDPLTLSYSNHQMFYIPKHYLDYPPQDIKLIGKQGQVYVFDPILQANYTGYYVQTSKSNQIAVLFIEITQIKSHDVIIYSHANSTDIGQMIQFYVDLAINLSINVIAYDYSGYGQSTGKLSDKNMLYDIKAVYKFAKNELQFQQNRIYLYGCSIGTGPSVALAAHSKYRVNGLILHSALSSGLKAVSQNLNDKFYSFDIFPNDEMLKQVECPVLIIHGTEDQDMLPYHVNLLAKSAKNLYKVEWIEGANHNNIAKDEKFAKQYYECLQNYFLDILTKEQSSLKQHEFSQEKPKLIENHYYQSFFNISKLSES